MTEHELTLDDAMAMAEPMRDETGVDPQFPDVGDLFYMDCIVCHESWAWSADAVVTVDEITDVSLIHFQSHGVE